MTILDYAILLFVLMETGNICILYFAPDSKLGNGVAVFDEWGASKEKEETHLFAKYMTNWVANVKLIFIVLLLVIVFTGNELTKIFGVVSLILSIAAYFWKLHPIIKRLDELGHITPKGYSKALFWMISGFVIMFSAALSIYFLV
ncbi:MAG: hypothetical protein R3Y47_10525 [Lachnospiraceae bacterium]